jgi:3-hydroxyacyl-CoA dehydrogenase
VASYAENTGKAFGSVSVHEDLESAVKNAWLVFEAVPEKLNIKIETFAELERLVSSWFETTMDYCRSC